MNQLHPLMRAEMRRRSPALNWCLELDHPTAGTVRMSREGVRSLSLGLYRRLLVSLGDLTLTLTGWRGTLTEPTFSAEFDDTGGAWTLAFGLDLRQAVVRGVLMGPRLPAEAYYTFFRGVVDRIGGPDQVKLFAGMRMNDDALEAQVPRPESEIRPSVFTSLPSDTDLRGKGIPLLFGDHDSSGLAAFGMVKLLYVGFVAGAGVWPAPDAARYRYLAFDTWDRIVVRAFADQVEKATPADYIVSRILTGDGRRVTVVDFVGDQASAEILVDVQDLVSPAGPLACFQQQQADYAYNDRHTDSYPVATAPINSASVATVDAVLAALGLGRSYYIGPDRRKNSEIYREVAHSYDVSMYWRGTGELTFVIWGLHAQDAQLYLGTGSEDEALAMCQVLRGTEYPLTHDVDPQSAITRIAGKSGRRASDGSWLDQRTVVVSRGGALERAQTIEMPCLPATAESIGNLQQLTPNGSSGATHIASFSGASIHATLAQGPPPAAPDLSMRVRTDTKTAIGVSAATVDLTLTDMPEIVGVANGTIWLICAASGAGADGADQDEITIQWLIGGTPYSTGLEPIVGVGFPHKYPVAISPLSPATGLPWTRAELSGLGLRLTWDPNAGTGAVLGGKSVDWHQCYVDVSYTAAANVSPASLAVLSRMANRYRTPPRIYKVDAPLRFLDYEIGDDVPVEDPRKGWGQKPWQRGRLRIIGMRLIPSKNCVALTLEDVRPQLTTCWIQGRALAAVDGTRAVGDGVAMLNPGSTVTVDRASPKYLDSPAGIDFQDAGPVVRVLNNTWPADRFGTLIERTRQNELVRSSFVSGGADLTESAGSGSIAYDTTVGEQLFLDSTVTAQHLLMTAGSPHTVETRLTWPATPSLTANGFMVLSADYRCSSLTGNDGPGLRLVRDGDGFYYNNATGLFQAGAIDNRLPESLTWKRFKSKVAGIVAGKVRTYTWSVSLPAGGTAARTARIGHNQLEEGQWASSRIVTDASVVARAADAIAFSNDAGGYKLWPNLRGTWRWAYIPLWSSADVAPGTQFYFQQLTYDANNRWELYYEVGVGFVFKARTGGVDVTAVMNVPIVAGTQYSIAARYTSAMAEQDLDRVLTLAVSDGTTITRADSSTYTTPLFAAARSMALGGHDTTPNLQCDGYLVELRQSPYCLKDAELAA